MERWFINTIKRRTRCLLLIIIEKYLDNLESDILIDYKFWCFYGKVMFVNDQYIVNGARLASMFDKC